MEATLGELEALLYGFNYQVFLRAYRAPYSPEAPAHWYVADALGPSAILEDVATTDEHSILTEAEQSLRYADESGSGPEPTVLGSRRFEDLLDEVLVELRQRIAAARCWRVSGSAKDAQRTRSSGTSVS